MDSSVEAALRYDHWKKLYLRTLGLGDNVRSLTQLSLLNQHVPAQVTSRVTPDPTPSSRFLIADILTEIWRRLRRCLS